MDYFLLHTCGIKENKTRASETIEINLIIHCYVCVLQAYADVSIGLTLTFYNKSSSLKPFGGSFICLYFFFSVGYLQVTTRKPITWRMAPWSQALTTSRYVFFFFKTLFFLITFASMNLFFKSTTQQLLLLLAFSFMKPLYCVRVRRKKTSIFAPTQDSLFHTARNCKVWWRPFRRWAGTFSDSYLMK